MTPYRTPPPDPKPKLSIWCRIGLHKWLSLGATGFVLDEKCIRPNCTACRETPLL